MASERRTRVTEEDKRRMRRLARDLESLDDTETVDIEGQRALLEWLNERRRRKGLPPIDRAEEAIPEQGLIERAKALGMAPFGDRGR